MPYIGCEGKPYSSSNVFMQRVGKMAVKDALCGFYQ